MNQRQLAEERSKKGICIVCGKADDKIARGLCVADWNRWSKQRKPMTAEQREEYDRRLIAEGYLLPSRQGRPAIEDDVFADVALEVLKDIAATQAEPSSTASDKAAHLAAEMASEAEEEQGVEPPAPKAKSTVPKKSPRRGKRGGA